MTNTEGADTTQAAAVAEQGAGVAPEKASSKKDATQKKGAPKGQKGNSKAREAMMADGVITPGKKKKAKIAKVQGDGKINRRAESEATREGSQARKARRRSAGGIEEEHHPGPPAPKRRRDAGRARRGLQLAEPQCPGLPQRDRVEEDGPRHRVLQEQGWRANVPDHEMLVAAGT